MLTMAVNLPGSYCAANGAMCRMKTGVSMTLRFSPSGTVARSRSMRKSRALWMSFL